MEFVIRTESWALREPFVIARETMLALPLVHLAISHSGFTGQAEAAGVDLTKAFFRRKPKAKKASKRVKR